jgi:hypothetical protein
MHLRQLRLGGYPFRADDLSLTLWEDLGVLEAYIQAKMPRLF